MESNSRALSSQAWGLQQLGIKLKYQATGTKTTNINRWTIIRKSIKNEPRGFDLQNFVVSSSYLPVRQMLRMID